MDNSIVVKFIIDACQLRNVVMTILAHTIFIEQGCDLLNDWHNVEDIPFITTYMCLWDLCTRVMVALV